VGRIRVVIADDVDRIRSLLRDLLEVDGRFRVVGEAGDGAEAVSLVSRERPDAVILDFSMPHLNGIDALPFIRAECPQARIVLMSSYPAGQLEGPAMEAGADAYVEKGSAVSELISSLVGTRAGASTEAEARAS
jgi:DNA-binding NarL/FixJ family response regulator